MGGSPSVVLMLICLLSAGLCHSPVLMDSSVLVALRGVLLLLLLVLLNTLQPFPCL